MPGQQPGGVASAASPARFHQPTAWWAVMQMTIVGYYGVTPLSNGNYVVKSPNWDNGATVDAGAVTWGSGTTGVAGPVTAAQQPGG